MEQLKIVVINLMAAVAGFLMPIRDFMFAMSALFVVNFLVGIIADLVEGNDWSWKKAAMFIVYCFVFFGLASFVFTCGHYMHNNEGALQCVSIICYIAIYLYGTNIARNMCGILNEDTPLWKLFDFIYWVLTWKWAPKIPYWNQYVKNHRSWKGPGSNENKGNFGGRRDE